MGEPKKMANLTLDELIEARAMSGFCGYCGITPGHSVGCPVARAEAIQSMLTGDAIAIVERAEQAEAELAAMTKERDNLRSLLEVTEDARSDWREEARKWEWVAEQCIQRGLMGGWQITDRDTFLDGLLARYQPEEDV